MISHITGKVLLREIGYVVIDVNGIGYKINTGLTDLGKEGDEVSIWTHLAVREDAMDLYGFKTREELKFFEQLIKISGIGPKSALGILSMAPLSTLKEAISRENIAYLTKISGIGRKTAEKIVIELRDKLGASESSGNLDGESDVLEALTVLGYGRREAQDVLRQVPASISGTSDRIKEAIKILSQTQK